MKEMMLYSTGDIGSMLNVAQTTIYNWIVAGILVPDIVEPDTSDGKSGKRRFKKETVDALIKSCMLTEYTGERLWSPGEMAQYFGVSTSCVRHWVRDGLLQPDMLLPSLNGKPAAKRFKESTVLTFEGRKRSNRKELGNVRFRKSSKNVPVTNKMLKTGDVARALWVHRSTILHYVESGILKPDKVDPPLREGQSGRMHFKPETVDALLQGCIVGHYDGGRLYSSAEIARLGGVAQSTVNKCVATGVLKPDVVLPSVRRGNRVSMRKYSEQTVQEFLAYRNRRGSKRDQDH